jgi:hypothetical protein
VFVGAIVPAAGCAPSDEGTDQAPWIPPGTGGVGSDGGPRDSSPNPTVTDTSNDDVTTSGPGGTATGDPDDVDSDGGDPSSTGDDGGAPPDCARIGYAGTCIGDVLWWCEGDALQSADCAAMGEVCGWENDAIGYNCLPAPGDGGFGYPVGDKTTYPAGGWTVTQVLGHYLNIPGFVGGHLAQDIAAGEAATAGAPVYAVAEGTVLYAGANASSYVNVVLLAHEVDGTTVCSFYGHLGSVAVSEGEYVARGDPIATVLDWQAHFGGANSHLHYVLLSSALCAASDAAGGALVCGYDDTAGPNGIVDLATEPASYTSVGDPCGTQAYPDAFLSPSQFIAAHHF